MTSNKLVLDSGCVVVLSDVSLLSKASVCGHLTVHSDDGAVMSVKIPKFGDVTCACTVDGNAVVMANMAEQIEPYSDKFPGKEIDTVEKILAE